VAVCLVCWGGTLAYAGPPSAFTAVDAPVLAPLPLDQDESAVAFGAGVYLGVWRDNAPGMSGVQFIAAARFDGAGVPLDADPLVLYSQGSSLDQPAVVFDGARFLIVWTDPINASDILGRYFAPDGTLGPVFTIGEQAGFMTAQFEAGAAAGDGFSLVAWTDGRGNDTHIRASLLNGDNSFVVQDVQLSTNSAVGIDARSATVTWGGPAAQNFIVAWQEGNNSIRQIDAALVSYTGAVTPVVPSPANPVPFAPSLNWIDSSNSPYKAQGPTSASDGQQYLVAWEDTRAAGARSAIWARAVPFDGQANTSDFQVGIGPVPSPGLSSNYLEPQAAFVDGNFLLAWVWQDFTQFHIYGGRVAASPSPSPLDGNGVELSPLQRIQLPSQSRRSALATDGNKAMLAFAQINNPLTVADVFLLPLDPSQPLGDVNEILLGRGHSSELGRSVASNGSVFLLVWEDTRNVTATGLDIYGLRVDHLGNPIDPQPFVICDAPGNQFIASAAAARDGNFLVVWSDGRNLAGDVDIYGTRVGASGAPLDGNGFRIHPGANPNARLAPAVAANDNGWLVAWEDWHNIFAATTPYPEIWATTVTLAGTVSTTALQVTNATAQNKIACAPVAAWNGQRYFVAYEQPCTQSALLLKGLVAGNWIDAAGTIVNPVAVSIGFSAVDSQSAPALAVDDTGRVVATWVSGGASINAAVINDNSDSTATTTVLATGPGNRDVPSVGFAPEAGGGGSLLFTWIDNNPLAVRAQRTDAQLQRLGSAFTVVAGATFIAPPPTVFPADFTGRDQASTPRLSSTADVAVTAGGSALVSVDQLATIGGRSYPRLGFVALGLQPRGAACGDANDCVDAVCTRGTCCDTPCNGICQSCGAAGCVDTPATDTRCGGAGVISCAWLSTSCRAYHDLPMNACSAFGECAEPGNAAECTSFDNATDGTPCSAGSCMGSCSAGICDCGGGLPDSGGRHAAAEPGSCACSVGGAGSFPWWLAFLWALLVLRRRATAN
jgi:MYXO-CTERM domain-containing protein